MFSSVVVVVDFNPLGILSDIGNVILFDLIALAAGDAQDEVVKG